MDYLNSLQTIWRNSVKLTHNFYGTLLPKWICKEILLKHLTELCFYKLKYTSIATCGTVQNIKSLFTMYPIWFPCLWEKSHWKFDETSHAFKWLFWLYDHAFSGSLLLQKPNLKHSGTIWYFLFCQKWRRQKWQRRTKSFYEYLHKIPIKVDLYIKQ